MATPSKDNSRQGGRRGGRDREPSEFAETTLSVDRVTRVVKGGRRMRFRAVVVVGNRKGKVGLGTGKANEVQIAVGKAVKAARRAMIIVPIAKGGTIPHEVRLKFKAAKLLLMPASEGTGIIAGGALRTVLDHAGVRNVLSKRFGTGNKLVNAQAVIQALQKLRPVRGKIVDPDAEKIDVSTPQIEAISREELKKRQDVARKAGEDVQA